jgi:hypothetical protein
VSSGPESPNNNNEPSIILREETTEGSGCRCLRVLDSVVDFQKPGSGVGFEECAAGKIV